MIERNKENERELIMEECNHDCSNCSANCDSRDPKSFIEQPHPLSKVKKVIAVPHTSSRNSVPTVIIAVWRL